MEPGELGRNDRCRGIVWIWMVERTVGGGAGRDDPACGSAGHGGECKEKGWEKC